VLSGKAANTNFKIFGLTRPGLEPTIYHTLTITPPMINYGQYNTNKIICSKNGGKDWVTRTSTKHITPPHKQLKKHDRNIARHIQRVSI